ncbi:MAG: caspase family protein [Muribaculaceae bacterium]|nr:caspase family protein [Muribaculaceae bacterium]
MNKQHRLKTIFTFAALIAAGFIYASGQSPEAPEEQSESVNQMPTEENQTATSEDGELLSPAEIAMNAMTDEYKILKELQYDGEDESTFYPRVMNMYLTATKALELAETEEQKMQIKNVLLDINGMLFKGAFYYSNSGDQRQLANFARAYIDSQRLPIFSDGDFKRDPRVYPTLVYVAASDTYNAGNFELAKDYFDIYLATGEEKMRHQVSTFMGQACINTKDYLKGINTLSNAAILYPDDYQLVAMGIQCCIDGGYADRIQPLLDRALLMKPGDEQLLNVQAQVYESTHDYKKALDIYNQIAELHPNSLENTQRIATCYYNLGADFYNKSIMEEDEKTAKKNRRQSRAYFESAAQYLEQIIATKPNDKQYLRALGITYGYLDNKDKFDDINIRLGALGEKPLAMGEVPEVMNGPLAVSGGGQGTTSAIAAPSYQEFAKNFIEGKLGDWAKKGEFEKIDDYQKRVTEGGLQSEYQKLKAQAEKEYLDKYAFSFVPRDLELQPYDATNETYLITTPYGDATIKVPLKNKEAEMFKSAWTNNNVEIRAPRYMIDNDKLAIASITFKTANGKSYSYDSSKASTYQTPDVKINLDNYLKQTASTQTTSSKPGNAKIIAKTSDVDKDIPETGKKNNNTFAFIVANENYKNVANVASALHDGQTFSEYCEKTLGIPKSQIIFLTDATFGDFWSEFENLKGRITNRPEDIDVILYYSGHGLPDDNTKEAYLMPVDAQPQHSRTMIKLQEVYDGLGKLPNASVYAFMDACFSGSSRESGQKDTPVVAARGVALKHKDVEPAGNVFVLSAASAQQTAFPYEEKDHGMFTYWLLKKLQDSKGGANLEDITTFVTDKVSGTSQEINRRAQTPTHKATGKLSGTWKSKKLRP